MARKTQREKILNQIALQDKVKALADVNIVTCGNCGSVVLHKLKATKIDCPYCNTILDVCDCPDYLYSGIENNEVY